MGAENIVLGRGMVFFDRFLPNSLVGEGERYFGNTTEFSIKRDIGSLDRIKSIRGVLSKKDALIIREAITGSFTSDNISPENVAEWYGSSPVSNDQLGIGYVTETIVVKKGRYYQLGKTFKPTGLRHTVHLTFTIDGVEIVENGNFVVDNLEGRFHVLADAPDVPDGSAVAVNFEWRSSPGAEEFASEVAQIEGSLRFVSTNPFGPRKSYFFPRIILSQSGSSSLKGDEWQQLSFEIEAIKLSPRIPMVYIDHETAPLHTKDEQSVVDDGPVSLDEFVLLNDVLNVIVNTDIPSRNY